MTFRGIVKNRNLMRDYNDIYERGFAFGKKAFTMKMDNILFAPAHFSELWNRGTAMAAGVTRYMRKETKFEDFGVGIPSAASPDAARAQWSVNGKIKIRTRNTST